MAYELITKRQYGNTPYLGMRKNGLITASSSFVKKNRLDTRGYYRAYIDLEKMSLKLEFLDHCPDIRNTYEVYFEERNGKPRRYVLGCMQKLMGHVLKNPPAAMRLNVTRVSDGMVEVALPQCLNNEHAYYAMERE